MNIDIIGVPLDLGAGRRGVDMGPSAIRDAGLKSALHELGYIVRDRGDITIPADETFEVREPNLRYLDPIVGVARQLADKVGSSIAESNFPLVLGGDHSIALGSVRGATRGKRLGVIWIDAHGDFNTAETTPSGNIHGMVLAALAGYGDRRLIVLDGDLQRTIDPANIVLIGIRDLDPGERQNLRQAGTTVFAMEQIDRIGLCNILGHAIEIASKNTDGLYLSLDLDSLDPFFAPGVGTPVPGGLSYREANVACQIIGETGRLVGMDLVEVNPILDHSNKTANLAVELALAALGRRVWNYEERPATPAPVEVRG